MRPFQVLSLLLVVCGSACGQEVTLRWKFEQGESEKYRLTQMAELDLQLESGRSVSTKVVRELDWTWQVPKVEDDGSANIAVNVTGVRLQVTGPAGEVTEFDSKSKEEPRGFAATMAPLFRTLMKSELKAQMSPLGEVDPNRIQLPEDLKIVIGSKPVGKAVGTIAKKEDLLPLVNLTLLALPDGPVDADKNWGAEQVLDTIPFGSTMASTTYRLESLDDSSGDEIATIIPQTTVSFVASDAGEPEVRIAEQESRGKILFDVTSGRLLSHESNETLKLETQGGRQPATGTLKQELKLETVSE